MAFADPTSPTRVGILPIAGFSVLSYAATVEPFLAANRLGGAFELLHFTAGGRTRSDGAAGIEVEYGVGDTPQLEMLLVVAGANAVEFNDMLTFRWLRRMAREVPVLAGVDGGAVILARADLLAGRSATVRTDLADDLAWISPSTRLYDTPSVLDRGRATARGGSDAAKLAGTLMAEYEGAPLARAAIQHTFGDMADGTLRAAPEALPGPVEDAITAMSSHLADPISLEALARQVRVSPRQLTRLFHEHIGQSVMGHYRRLRLEKAREMVERSKLPLTEIALVTGFANSAHFSTVFAQEFGLSPSRLRRQGDQAG